MFRTASTVSSGPEERAESLSLARMIAASNGYRNNTNYGSRARWCTKMTSAQPTSPAISDKIPFFVPFISDEVSAALRQCLRRANLNDLVAITDIPPRNLKRLLIRNRLYDRVCTTPDCVICPSAREGDCLSSGTVYLITCLSCGDEYIGESARALSVRIREHLVGKEKSRCSTPLGAHRVRNHAGADFEVSVKILAYEARTPARKTLEAFWIRAQNPKMNRKDECLTITRELEPYLGQIF